MRQPILYAEAMWRRQWYFGVLLIVIGGGIVVLNAFVPAARRATGGNTWLWEAYVPAGLLLLAALLLYRWRHHVQVRDDRLHVGNLLSSVDIDYELIRSVRVQPLKTHFEAAHRKRYRHPAVRDYEERQALFIRLRKDEAMTSYIARKLGPRLVAEDTLALPVPDPDALSWEIGARLPEKMGANLGGRRGRRGKRRR